MQVKKIDLSCPDLYKFRREIICDEHNASLDFLNNIIPHSAILNEEVWKFSKKKWESIMFDSMFGVYIGDDLAAISGAKRYGNSGEFLRVGMMYYVLRRFRNIARSTLWSANGLIESALNFHKLESPVDYSFISIYPHNSKLSALCTVMSQKRRYGQLGSGSSLHVDLMKQYSVFERPIMFNGVMQHILFKSENGTTPNIYSLVTSLETK